MEADPMNQVLKGHAFSRAGGREEVNWVLKGHGFSRAGGHEEVNWVLKGHGFSRAVSSTERIGLQPLRYFGLVSRASVK
jgi:hypothetical protein